MLDQNYPNLEYIIVDGGSTDESVDIIKRYEPHLPYWLSEPDTGQSHAIGKGAAVERGRHERGQLDRAEQAGEERRVRHDVHLVRERDERRLRAEPRQEGPELQEAVVARLAQRADVDEQPPRAHAMAQRCSAASRRPNATRTKPISPSKARRTFGRRMKSPALPTTIA